MKKIIAIFSVILTLGVFTTDVFAKGRCRQHLCKTNESFSELLSVTGITENDNGGKTKTDLDGLMCYHCDINNIGGGIGDDDCTWGAYVATVASGVTKLFMCVDKTGDKDAWEKVNLTSLSVCSGSDVISQGVVNSTCVLSDNGAPVRVTDVVATPCMKCSCNGGYKHNADNTACVLDPVAQETCKNSHGIWNVGASKCDCDGGRGLVNDGDTKCKCADSQSNWDDTCGRCVNPGAVSDECGAGSWSNTEKYRGTFERLKSICENDWKMVWMPGTWDWENADGRNPEKWKCDCKGVGITNFGNSSCVCNVADGYIAESINPPYKCKQTDCIGIKQACDKVSGAVYKEYGTAHNRQNCRCECMEQNKVFNGAECVEIVDPIAKICASTDGATVARDGRCLCLSTSMSPINGKCPESGAILKTVSGESVEDEINKKKEQISALHRDLMNISNGFGRSHWKTSSGNFNGARLASDSIAGVVLGTVGGVVTSNVIKKNQVKGGFEDINCAIGGQRVAGYDDVFKVGIH